MPASLTRRQHQLGTLIDGQSGGAAELVAVTAHVFSGVVVSHQQADFRLTLLLRGTHRGGDVPDQGAALANGELRLCLGEENAASVEVGGLPRAAGRGLLVRRRGGIPIAADRMNGE